MWSTYEGGRSIEVGCVVGGQSRRATERRVEDKPLTTTSGWRKGDRYKSTSALLYTAV